MRAFSPQEFESFEQAIYFLHVDELRELCSKLQLSSKGTKLPLIERLLHWLKTGKSLQTTELSASCIARRDRDYPLAAQTPILQGSYKNNLATRNFMKKLTNESFHFTAAGQDWIRQQWQTGQPPTYQQLADFWIAHQAKNRREKPRLKREWAYLNFMQRFGRQHPQASKKQATEAWKREREQKSHYVHTYIQKSLKMPVL